MTMQESLSTMAVAVALAGRITVAGPGITVAGRPAPPAADRGARITVAGPGITVAGPGVAGPGITVAGPGVAGPDGPCSEEEMPRSCRYAARQIARN